MNRDRLTDDCLMWFLFWAMAVSAVLLCVHSARVEMAAQKRHDAVMASAVPPARPKGLNRPMR